MTPTKIIALLGLGGVGLYLLYRTSRHSTDMGDALSLFDPLFGPDTTVPSVGPGNTSGTGPAKAPAPGTNAIGAIGAPIAGALTGAAAAITAGVTAGAALLAWGVTTQGWLRGGEEGIKVNPARDRYLSQFAQYDPYRDAGNPPGFYGLAHVLTVVTGQDGGGELFHALNRADSMDEFNAAISAINNTLARASPAQVAAARAASAYAA